MLIQQIIVSQRNLLNLKKKCIILKIFNINIFFVHLFQPIYHTHINFCLILIALLFKFWIFCSQSILHSNLVMRQFNGLMGNVPLKLDAISLFTCLKSICTKSEKFIYIFKMKTNKIKYKSKAASFPANVKWNKSMAQKIYKRHFYHRFLSSKKSSLEVSCTSNRISFIRFLYFLYLIELIFKF